MFTALFHPATHDVLFAFKTCVAALLALFLAFFFDLVNPFWALTTAFIITHPLYGASASKAAYRLAGTLAGGLATLVILPNLVNAPELLILCVSIWIGGCLALSLLDRTAKSYAYMLAGYTCAMTSFPLVDRPGSAFDYTVARVIEISLAIGCVLFVNRMLFPQSAGAVLKQRLDGWMEQASAEIRNALSEPRSPSSVAELARTLGAELADIRFFSVHASYERDDRLWRGCMDAQELMNALLPVACGLCDILHHYESLRLPLPPELSEALQFIAETSVATDNERGQQTQAAFAAVRRFADQRGDRPGTWNDMLAVDLAHQILSLQDIWEQCLLLASGQSHLASGQSQSSRRSRWQKRLRSAVKSRPVHRDLKGAIQAGTAAACAVLLACTFWIATAWQNGAGAAILAGVLMSFFAAMDNSLPVLKKFAVLTLCTASIAFVFQFAVMPMLDGFIPFAEALVLLLFPLSLLLARPQTFLHGMTIATTIPSMIPLQTRPTYDLALFLNSTVSSFVGIGCAVVVTILMKTLTTEASLARVLSTGWRDVAMAFSGSISRNELLGRILDKLTLISPRAAALPATSPMRTVEIVHDLNLALNGGSIHEIIPALPAQLRQPAEKVLDTFAIQYRQMARDIRSRPDQDRNLAMLDRIIGLSHHHGYETAPEMQRLAVQTLERNLRAIRYSLFPDAYAPHLPAHAAIGEAAE
jgi:uncharacterized membrane protein YccC